MSNPTQQNVNNRIIEKDNLIKKLKSIFVQMQPQFYQKTIEQALSLVGDFLNLNRIAVISSTIETPISWCLLSDQTTSSCFNHVEEKLLKHLNDEYVVTDSWVDLNATHPILQGIECDNQMQLSLKKLFNLQDYKGFILIEHNQENHAMDPCDIEVLTIFPSFISETLILDHYHRELSKWREKAESANHLKDQFLSNINHEIQTPLGGIHNAMYLLGSTDLDHEQKEFLQIAQTSLERLSSVVEDVLNISKLESGQVEIYRVSFDLEEELIRVLRIHKSSVVEKGLEMSFSFDHNIQFELIGDLKKLRQILMNLMSNAIKYTEKGSIHLSAEIVQQSPLIISFSIKDTGIGINEQEAKRIYQEFYQSDASLSKKQQGVGLGLSITSHLVRLLNGKLDMESEVNKGTTFRVQLPFEPGEVFKYPQLEHLSALFTSEYAEDLSSYAVLSAMGVTPYTIHQALETKFDFIVFEGVIQDTDQIEYLKKMYGNDHAIAIHFQSSEQQKISNIDCSFKSPTSKKSIYQRLCTHCG